ncbi:MAG: alpha-L-fucosidase [Clostridia bacterium]|nr:alpha-L-fucosidase [Clostridia bacterium]
MANNVKPTQKQLEFLDWEIGVFFHFGIRTFYEGHRDWDGKPMSLEAFNPTELDCDGWIKTAYDGGAKYAILVCKHHDGFANWPSKYTDYSVKNTPWKNGKGDVVREFTDACRKYGLKVGLYYSPAQFGSREMNSTEYDDYFINQLGELLTDYGKIDYLWFDGCGSENHEYDTKRIVGEIRRLQPDILLFNMWDPDTRWVGNECGFAKMPNVNVVNELDFSVQTSTKDALDRDVFLPVECDFRIRDHWFYSENDSATLKSTDELMGNYLYTVGRGANMLLNIAPDRSGRLPQKDAQRFVDFGRRVAAKYGSPLVKAENPVFSDGSISVKLEEPTVIDSVMITENIESCEKASLVRVYIRPQWCGDPILVASAESIGHKLILSFPPARTDEVIIEVLGKDGMKITSVSVFAH